MVDWQAVKNAQLAQQSSHVSAGDKGETEQTNAAASRGQGKENDTEPQAQAIQGAGEQGQSRKGKAIEKRSEVHTGDESLQDKGPAETGQVNKGDNDNALIIKGKSNKDRTGQSGNGESRAGEGVNEVEKVGKGENPSTQTPATIKKRARQGKFLDAWLNNGANVQKAAKSIGISDRTHYDWLEHDKEYQKEFENAKLKLRDALVGEALRRATGYDQEIVYKGQVTGKYKVWSDNLLMFLLKQLDPTFRDNYNTINAFRGGDIKITLAEPPEGRRVVEAEYREADSS